MNLLHTPGLKVGFFVLVMLSLIAALSMQASEDPGYLGSSQIAKFRLDDASGLIPRSAVKVAGIDVGVIRSMSYDNGKALLVVSLRGDIKLTTSAQVEIRPNGILGDKYVEIVPGNPNDPALADGSEILIVNNRASMDKIMKNIGQVTDSITDVANALRSAVQDGGENAGPLGRIIHNIDRLSGDLADLGEGNREKIDEIVSNINEITNTINDVVRDDSPTGLKASWARVSRSLNNIEEITDKINNGQGTIGKLVNDDQTVEKLNTAIDGVNSFVGGASKVTTSIDFHTEYLAQQDLAKSYLGLRIQPGLDRYYEIQAVDDPKGVVERVDTSTTTGGSTTDTKEVKTYKSKIKLTILFAKNFYDFTVKGGMIENSGGLGFDYHLFKKRLRLSTDIYDFSNSPPHLRSSARYYVVRGIYFTGGADDILSRDGTFSSFIGAGIDLTNDDLKMLLTKSPF